MKIIRLKHELTQTIKHLVRNIELKELRTKRSVSGSTKERNHMEPMGYTKPRQFMKT